MLPGLEQLACPELAVPASIMRHVIAVESSYNPYAIGVVGGRLARQPKGLEEALATVRMLEAKGYNFSLGLAQVNRYNLRKQGLENYEQAFSQCPNLQAGARILAECHARAKGDWGKAFSCYYSGNFSTGFKHGYVQKVFASMQRSAGSGAGPVPVMDETADSPRRLHPGPGVSARDDQATLGRVRARVNDAIRRAAGAASSVDAQAAMQPSADDSLQAAAAPFPAGLGPVVLRPWGAEPADAQRLVNDSTDEKAGIPRSPADAAFVF